MTPNGEMTKPLKGVGISMTERVLSHHEVMYRLDCVEMERGKFVLFYALVSQSVF